MFAVILTGAKQYLVKEGDKIQVEKIATPEGDKHVFDKVLLLSKDDKEVEMGTPFLKNTVEGKVLTQAKGPKTRVFKMKPKKGYRRTFGHRQAFTELEITKIS